MFDDPNLKKQGQVPDNLPIEEPEDMFAGVEKEIVPAGKSADMPKAEMKQVPPSAVSVGKLQAKTSQPPTASLAPKTRLAEPSIKVMPEEMEQFNKIKGPAFARNLMIVIVVLIVIGLLGGGSWVVYTLFIKPPIEVNDFTVPENIEAGQPEEESVTAPEFTGQATDEDGFDAGSVSTDESILFGELVDSDADNLSDSVEEQLGTDIDFWDTDRDGLSDGDEINIWQSDPLKVDTDGDSYNDGDEVKNGYNPIGSGTIFEMPQE